MLNPKEKHMSTRVKYTKKLVRETERRFKQWLDGEKDIYQAYKKPSELKEEAWKNISAQWASNPCHMGTLKVLTYSITYFVAGYPVKIDGKDFLLVIKPSTDILLPLECIGKKITGYNKVEDING